MLQIKIWEGFLIMDNEKNKNFIDKLDKTNFNLDTINISEIELARSIIDKLPDVREDKIREMKRKYADPNYKVDEYDIADRILENYKKYV